jgi:hypothetical protein
MLNFWRVELYHKYSKNRSLGPNMSMSRDPTRYRAFLLTLWEERNRDAGSPPVWRFRLEDPRTGQQRGFASLESLVEALKQVIADSDE